MEQKKEGMKNLYTCNLDYTNSPFQELKAVRAGYMIRGILSPEGNDSGFCFLAQLYGSGPVA